MPLEPSEARNIIGRRRDNYVVVGVMIALAIIIMVVMIWLKCMQYDFQNQTMVTCSCCRSECSSAHVLAERQTDIYWCKPSIHSQALSYDRRTLATPLDR